MLKGASVGALFRLQAGLVGPFKRQRKRSIPAKMTTIHQGHGIVDLTRWFTPAEALAVATSANGALLALSGLRNPYPGKLGVVEQGALADLLLVDGNPLENIDLVADPANKFLVIMKDGVIYKDTIPK